MLPMDVIRWNKIGRSYGVVNGLHPLLQDRSVPLRWTLCVYYLKSGGLDDFVTEHIIHSL